MKRLTVFNFWMALITFSLCSCSLGKPQVGVNSFYKAYLEVRPLGLPEKNQQELLNPWVTNNLSKLISDSRTASDGDTEEGPPLIEGDIFSSNFEGATDFAITGCSKWGKRRKCKVEFSYLGPTDKSKFQWTDTVYVNQESGKWVIDEIEYGGNWPFSSKGTLRDKLQGVLNYYRRK